MLGKLRTDRKSIVRDQQVFAVPSTPVPSETSSTTTWRPDEQTESFLIPDLPSSTHPASESVIPTSTKIPVEFYLKHTSIVVFLSNSNFSFLFSSSQLFQPILVEQQPFILLRFLFTKLNHCRLFLLLTNNLNWILPNLLLLFQLTFGLRVNVSFCLANINFGFFVFFPVIWANFFRWSKWDPFCGSSYWESSSYICHESHWGT